MKNKSFIGIDISKNVIDASIFCEVKTGNEAQISIDKNSQADYREKLNAELEAMRNKEMWQAGVTVRKLRPENN